MATLEVELKDALNVEANLPDAFPVNYRGQMQITPNTDVAVAAISTYEKVAGTYTDSFLEKFTLNTDGTLTYTGPQTCFLFTGVSDLQADKTGTLTLGLYKNGALVAGAETPHTFTSAAKTSNVSITRIIELTEGDELEVYMKYTDDTATITFKSLTVTFWK